jgi:hypothetical protein
MKRLAWWTVVAAMSGLSLGVLGCAASPDASDSAFDGDGAGGGSTGSSGACTPGKQDACACPGGVMGVQACLPDGSGYDACDCGGGGTGGSAPTVGCGDGVCSMDESCHTCDGDCGTCAPCTEAPSCKEADIPPPSMPHAGGLDVAMQYLSKPEILARLEKRIAEAGPGVRTLAAALAAPRRGESPLATHLRKVLKASPKGEAALRAGLAKAGMSAPAAFALKNPETAPLPHVMTDEFPDGGTVECGAPLLRVRVAQVHVIEEDDDFANDIVYCSIVSEAKTGSEVRVTPETPNLDEGDSFSYSIDSGIIWGQNGPRKAGGNLMITYDCFEADSNDGYQNLIDSIANASSQIGGVLNDLGMQGWIFTVAGAVLPVVSDALALDGDDHLFNANQIIPADQQLALTNGGYWTVRKNGTHLNSDWDWELRVEAWGCAEYGQD